MADEMLVLGFLAILDQAIDTCEAELEEAKQAGDDVGAMRCRGDLAELVALRRQAHADSC